MKYSGTVARGVKAPIIRSGDNIVEIVIDSIMDLVKYENIDINDGDIVCITESIVAIAQGNFASIDDIAIDIKKKLPGDSVGVVFPILSRNRFSMILRAFSLAYDKIYILLTYPTDEVGNRFITEDEIINSKINPYLDSLTYKEFRKLFKNTNHEYTNIDYIEYYREITNYKAEIILSNSPETILKYTDQVIVANVHNRVATKDILFKHGGQNIIGLDNILTESVNGSGYNPTYGLLGANLASNERVKLFPRDSEKLVYDIKNKLKESFNREMEVMVYGDGAFKDPQSGIWELCDPLVAPGFTSGLKGTPSEIKLKYLAETKAQDLSGETLEAEIKRLIKAKDENLVGKMDSQGTTPRQISDLLGTLADLISGSGDKGTPIVLIQNYFSNYAS